MEKALVSLFAVLLFVPLTTFGQGAPPRKLPLGPLEKYDNPPAPPRALKFSPRKVAQYSTFTSYQANVDVNGNNILGDAANEPSICVDPTDPNRMAIGWRQFDDVSSNFRQAGYAYTTNGGSSWTFPGVLENNVFRSDPVLNADDTGRFFYLSLLQSFFDNLWRSLNGGQSWTNIAPADGGDKQWFTIDNTNSSGHGFQYQAWSTDGNNYQGRQFSRSTNGGFTWQDPINIPNTPRWGTLDVDSNGILFIGGVNLNTNRIWCVRSSNAKNGAVTPSFDQSTAVNLGGSIGFSQPINPEGLVGQVNLAVDRSGTSTNNNVYILASVQPDGFTTGSDVMFVRSTDGGQNFNTPRRISDDPVNPASWHWFGTLSVAPNGRIDAIWLDTRNAANNTDSQLFYSYSTDGGDTWSANVAVSNSFDPFLGYPNQNKMGDYITIVSDTTGANAAYCATFNNEQDVYYVRLITPPSAPSADAATNIMSSRFTANWTGVTGATGYQLDVSTSNTFGSYVPGYQDLNIGNVTSFSVSGLGPNTTYYYRVRAYNNGGTSASSNTVTVLTAPAAPTANAASNVTSGSFAANWSAVNGASGYRLDVSTSNVFGSYVTGYQDLDVGNSTSWYVIGLSPGTTYYYRVRAYNSSATSDNSSGVSQITVPATPTAGAASNVTGSSFAANWSGVSGASGYRLDVSTSNVFGSYVSGYQDLDVGNSTSWYVIGLSPNTTYYYRVRAYNNGGTTGNSNTITVLTAPAAPAANAASSITNNSFTANWSAVSGATSYRLDVSPSSAFSSYVSGYQDVDVGNVTNRNVTGLSAGGTYYYRIRARNGVLISGNSNVISVTLVPGAPTATTATGVTSHWFNANWNSSTGASSYRLDVSTTNSFASYLPGYQDRNVGNVISFSVKGLTQDTNYYYRVRAFNNNGLSGNSNVINVQTTIPPSPTPRPSATPKPSATPGPTPTPRPSSTPK